ncbi:MAG: phosphoenolpyruvate hydrolase family protein [Thermodesulfobacteriota bacterium]
MKARASHLRNILAKSRQSQFPLIFVIPGSGQIARCAREGGADFIMVLNAGLYRQSGVSSMGSFLPFGNANDQTEFLLRTQILPRARHVPLVGGLMPDDPVMPLEARLARYAELGLAGITNWPAVGLVDGLYREALAEEGFTVEAEITMLKEAERRGFVTFGFVLSVEDAARMAQAGMDGLILNLGWTHETHDIFEKADRIEHAAVKINEMLAAVKNTGADPICLFFGGAVLRPEDSATIYQRTSLHGYGGGSSFERIPVARLITETVRRFKAIPRRDHQAPFHQGLGRLIGVSPPMIKLYRLIERVSPFDVSVCLEGETGVGKELIAAQIHRLSNRSSQPFITLNCGAIPDTLLESEFFGHEKGAFTGAISRRLGKFELADRGTLFLDEVSELSPKAQVSLLRVLQQKEISRVGGEKAIAVDFRIITATHQNLKALVDQGRFRADLYFRLAMITLKIPPLRQRLLDIPALINSFLAELNLQFNREVIGLTQEFIRRLMKHAWPGNVRELKHVLTRVILLEDGPILQGEDFVPETDIKLTQVGASDPRAYAPPGGIEEDTLLAAALQATGGNKLKAARLLGISRKTLYSRLKRTGPGPEERKNSGKESDIPGQDLPGPGAVGRADQAFPLHDLDDPRGPVVPDP